MIRQIIDLPDGVFGVEAQGTIEKGELDDVANSFRQAVSEQYDQRLLFEFASDAHFSPDADRDRFANRILARGSVSRVAMLGGPSNRREYDEIIKFIDFTSSEFCVFEPNARKTALAWLIR